MVLPAAGETGWATKLNDHINALPQPGHTHGVADLTATGTKNSTTYLRGDNTWATPAGGSADGNTPPGVVRPPVGWFVAPYNLSGTKGGKAIASLRASCIIVPATMTVDQVGIVVTLAGATENAKLLVYSSDAGGLPTTLVIDSGPMSLATVGNVTPLITAVVLPPGIYWGFLVTDGTTAQVEAASQDERQSIADTFNRVRNTLAEWWTASAGTYAAPAATITSYTWSTYGENGNVALMWAMRRSA